MSTIPVQFLHTDADAHLPPPGHRWSHVRRYRTRSFAFPLAVDERALRVASQYLAPLARRERRRLAAWAVLPLSLVLALLGVALEGGALVALPLPVTVAFLAAASAAVALGARAAMLRRFRRAGLAGGETIVLTHQRVLHFTPAPWEWRSAPPGAESPYDVTEVAHESIATVRAAPVLGSERSGVLEIVTTRGERLVFVHVPEAEAMAARIREVASAYTECGKVPAGRGRVGSLTV